MSLIDKERVNDCDNDYNNDCNNDYNNDKIMNNPNNSIDKLKAVQDAIKNNNSHFKSVSGKSFLISKFGNIFGRVGGENKFSETSSYVLMVHIFTELIAYIITGGLVGYFIDSRANIYPICTIIACIIAFVGFMKKIYQDFFMKDLGSLSSEKKS